MFMKRSRRLCDVFLTFFSKCCQSGTVVLVARFSLASVPRLPTRCVGLVSMNTVASQLSSQHVLYDHSNYHQVKRSETILVLTNKL